MAPFLFWSVSNDSLFALAIFVRKIAVFSDISTCSAIYQASKERRLYSIGVIFICFGFPALASS